MATHTVVLVPDFFAPFYFGGDVCFMSLLGDFAHSVDRQKEEEAGAERSTSEEKQFCL
jgi:hypothetical protein